MRTLGIETSGIRGSVALVEEGRLVSRAHHSALNRHAEETLGLVEQVLREAGWEKRSLDRVGVSVGPGAFTGVRVGVALAKGLSLGLGIPALGVGSLQVSAAATLLDVGGRLAFDTSPESPLRVVVRDARREEFFVAAYDGVMNEVLAPLAVPQRETARFIAESFSGRSYRLVGVVEGEGGLLSSSGEEPDAGLVALLAEQREVGLHPLDPVYVRDSGATRQNLPESPLERARVSNSPRRE